MWGAGRERERRERERARACFLLSLSLSLFQPSHPPGVYHCGLVVYGSEIAFGGHEFPTSGIFRTAPGDVPGAVLRESLHLGETALSPAEVGALVDELGRTAFRGCDYSLLQRNCNHLTALLAERLVPGAAVPAWPNRLADLAVTLHCLLPAALVPPLATPSSVTVAGAGAGRRRPEGEEEGAALLGRPPTAAAMHRGR